MVGKALLWPRTGRSGLYGGNRNSTGMSGGTYHATEQAGKIAFVLSGGAVRGAIQVGMVRALLSHGIIPHLIVGTSVGALNGAWLASAPTMDGIQDLEDIWLRLRQEDIFTGGSIGVLLHLVRRLPSLYSGNGIQAFVHRVVALSAMESATFEHLKVPLAIVATNLTRGRAAIFDHGQLIPALLASSAIPAVLPPVTIDGEQYVDGGLLDNVGLRVAIERGATQIFVLDTSCDGVAERPATSLEGIIERSVQVVTSFHLQCALERYADRAQVVVLRDDGRVACDGADFSAIQSMMCAGQAIAEEALAAPKRATKRAIASHRASSLPRHTLTRAAPTRTDRATSQRFMSIRGIIGSWIERALAFASFRTRTATLPPPTPLPSSHPQRAAS